MNPAKRAEDFTIQEIQASEEHMSAGSPAETSLLERIGKAPFFPTKPPDVVLSKLVDFRPGPLVM